MNEKRLTVRDIAARKGCTPLVCLTAYTAPMTKIMDKHVDVILVGDSLGMVVYGFDSTVPVTMEMMVAHGSAVARSSKNALVVVDMPFGSYQASREQAFENAARLMKETGCAAVKLEGGAEMAETIEFLTQRGIPVMGHIGLQPQSVNAAGGYRVMGRTVEEEKKIAFDAAAVAQAGAFAVVIECTAEALAAAITKEIAIPTIGIGASASCDGQILVVDDMLGLSGDNIPKFVKKFADAALMIDSAIATYADAVRTREFPSETNTYSVSPAIKSTQKKAG
jgi:3-methyl-2-oxobutanoate hydroxymethyltransferase